jgi:hypothetical protein
MLQPNVLPILVLCCSMGFHVARCKYGSFVCFTHMLQVRVPNVSSTFRRILHSNVFHVVSVLCCMNGGLANGASGGRWMVVLRSGRTRSQLLIVALDCCPHGERERRESGMTDGRIDK